MNIRIVQTFGLLFLNVFILMDLVHSQEVSSQQIDNLLRTSGLIKNQIKEKVKSVSVPEKEIEKFLDQERGAGILSEQEGEPPKEEYSKEEEKELRNLPFGYDIFNLPPQSFEPYDYGSVDPDYPIGPNDEILIYIWGEVELFHQLKVNREGKIFIPQVGMIHVNGLTLGEVQAKIINRMSMVYSGIKNKKTYVDISLGDRKKIRIFITGKVLKPGGYTISSVSTAFNALYYAGGSCLKGSLRNVKVFRNGDKIMIIDLYDYIIRGDNRNDIRLQNGDIIVVPPVEKRVTLEGAILFPAEYELKSDEGLKKLLELAGGTEPNAYLENIHILRFVENSEPKMLDLNLKQLLEEDSDFYLQNGDIITIPEILTLPANYVTIMGEVLMPGKYEITEGMTVNDLIRKAGGLQKSSYQLAVEVSRIPSEGKTDSSLVYKINKKNEHFEQFFLKPMDMIFVRKDPKFKHQEMVLIKGEVKFPGQYALQSKHERLSSLIERAGGLTSSAHMEAIQFSREGVGNIDINWQSNDDNIELREGDNITIPLKPATVKVLGEVLFPTNVLYEAGFTVSDYIKKSGGYTDKADKKKVVLILANGRVVRRKKSLGSKNINQIMHGATIFVPKKTSEGIDWIEVIKNTTSIISSVVMTIFLIQKLD